MSNRNPPAFQPPAKLKGGRVYCLVEKIRQMPAYRGAKTGSFSLTLACGHVSRRKMSDGAGKYALCPVCDLKTDDEKRCLIASQTPEGRCTNCGQNH